MALVRNDSSAKIFFVKFEVASWPKMAMNQNGCFSARNFFSVKFDCGFLVKNGFLAANALLLKVLKNLARL